MNNELNRIDESIRRIVNDLNMYDDQLRNLHYNRYNYPGYHQSYNPYYYPNSTLVNPMFNSPLNSTNYFRQPIPEPHPLFTQNTTQTNNETFPRRQTRNNATRNRRTRGVIDNLLRNLTTNNMHRNVESIEISINDIPENPTEGLFSNIFNTPNRGTTLKKLRTGTEILINTDSNEEICSICQDRILEQQVVRKISNCGHCFHIRCLERWLEEHEKCPHCRTIVAAPTQNENQEATNQNEQNTQQQNQQATSSNATEEEV